jgi:hypothetical protein
MQSEGPRILETPVIFFFRTMEEDFMLSPLLIKAQTCWDTLNLIG